MEELEWVKELQVEYAERKKHGIKSFHYTADPDSCLKDAAADGDMSARQQLLANAAESGLFVRAAENDADAEYELGELFSRIDEDDEMAKWFYKFAAEHGNTKAAFALGEMCLNDDRAKAAEYLKKAAELCQDKNMVFRACKLLGDIYLKDKDIPKNYEKAAFYYRKIAKEGSGYLRVQGLLGLARCYQAEDCPFIDTHKAFLIFYELAKIPMEVNEALGEVVHCYEKGIGVEKNEKLANELRELVKEINPWVLKK